MPRADRQAATKGMANSRDAHRSIYDRIYAVVRRIPPRRVATYGQVAALVPWCSGPRQVGYALHALPEGTGIPWHRVVNARGTLSVRGANAITQLLRLEREGVRLSHAAHPHDPAFAPDGSAWYTGQRNNVLGRLDPATGQIILEEERCSSSASK